MTPQPSITKVGRPGGTNAPRLRAAAWLFVAVSVLLFLASLSQNCYYTDGDTWGKGARGVELLLIGWSGVGVGVPAWLANPALVWAWIAAFVRPTRIAALVAAAGAAVLALSFLRQQEIMVDEAGHLARITGYGAGYWLWVASTISALVGCAFSVAGASKRAGIDSGQSPAPPKQ
jgi:hypothetical protein